MFNSTTIEIDDDDDDNDDDNDDDDDDDDDDGAQITCNKYNPRVVHFQW